jgi:hypothetical protein
MQTRQGSCIENGSRVANVVVWGGGTHNVSPISQQRKPIAETFRPVRPNDRNSMAAPNPAASRAVNIMRLELILRAVDVPEPLQRIGAQGETKAGPVRRMHTFFHRRKVRTRLAAGGRWIRTFGPPSESHSCRHRYLPLRRRFQRL